MENEGLAQGLYVAARAGVEPTTLRTLGIDSTNEPPRPTWSVTSSDYILMRLPVDRSWSAEDQIWKDHAADIAQDSIEQSEGSGRHFDPG